MFNMMFHNPLTASNMPHKQTMLLQYEQKRPGPQYHTNSYYIMPYDYCYCINIPYGSDRNHQNDGSTKRERKIAVTVTYAYCVYANEAGHNGNLCERDTQHIWVCV